MIDLNKMEASVNHLMRLYPKDTRATQSLGEVNEVITRLRQAEKNAELKDLISKIGMDVGIATTGQVPGEHPIKSRLEMVAKLGKDAARYRWLRDFHIGNCPENINLDGCGGLDSAIDEAMQCK